MHQTSTLVTGAAGFAGRHLLARLRATPAHGPLAAWSQYAPPHAEPGVTWQQVDITDRDAVTRAITRTQPDRIVHLAGSPHVGQSWRDTLSPLRVNVMGTHHVLEAIRQHRPTARILVVSSATIYRASDAALDEDAAIGPASPYALSKLAQDELALAASREDGLNVVVARPFNHVGPGQDAAFFLSSFAKQIALIEAGLRPAEIQVGNLDAERDLTDVRDVAEAYVRLLDDGVTGRAYNICAGQAYRIGDILDRLIARARVPIRCVVDPERLRPSDVARLLGNGARMDLEIGWRPRHSIDVTLADTLDEWRGAVAAGRVRD